MTREQAEEVADAILGEDIYKTAPDIFSDVWSVLRESEDYDAMREKIIARLMGVPS
jgi:hypothetical protein